MNFFTPQEVAKEISIQTENLILEQLNEFVKRGLIVIEQGPMSFVRNLNCDEIKIERTVSLVLKDQEYIEKLEAENKELKSLIDKLKAII